MLLSTSQPDDRLGKLLAVLLVLLLAKTIFTNH
jgi:hypothetical protein